MEVATAGKKPDCAVTSGIASIPAPIAVPATKADPLITFERETGLTCEYDGISNSITNLICNFFFEIERKYLEKNGYISLWGGHDGKRNERSERKSLKQPFWFPLKNELIITTLVFQSTKIIFMDSLPIKATSKGLVLCVKVVPKASRNQISGWEGEELKVRLNAVPEKGKANETLIAFLAKELAISQSQIQLASGETSRHKRLLITGLSLQDCEKKLTCILASNK